MAAHVAGREAFADRVVPHSVRGPATEDAAPGPASAAEERADDGVPEWDSIGLFDIFCLGPLAERFELGQADVRLAPLLKSNRTHR
ncbi:hypothetical protein [Streptomyces sp. NPDC048191]|uniref:hypothetical protein n=1 Tax=Streptomyces sp. NPDC048191 TaxID=3155484 RepID=UPI0034006622